MSKELNRRQFVSSTLTAGAGITLAMQRGWGRNFGWILAHRQEDTTELRTRSHDA